MTVPASSAGSAQIAPPCASTILRHTASEIPQPSTSSPCACLNIEKISSPRSGGTPTPLSWTLNSHVGSRRSAEIARRLVGVALEPVGHEILRDAPELRAIAPNHRHVGDLEMPVELLDGARKRGGDVGHQRAGVDVVDRAACARARVLEDSVDQAARPRMRLLHAREHLLVLRGPAV